MAAACSSNNVKLLGLRASHFVNRAQFAFNLKSVNYELLAENLAAKSELLLKSNPVHKMVPVLLINGDPICESLVILEYIDEKWLEGPSILPSDPYDRAIARFWAAYIDDKWWPAFRAFMKAEEEEARAAALEGTLEGLTLLEDVFVKSAGKIGKGFFGGDNLGYLDIVLGCFLGWLKVAEINSNVKIIDETKTPALVGWAERFKSHEAVKGTLPETQELQDYLKGLQARVTASN